MDEAYRHEYKLPINLSDYHSLRRRVRQVAAPDAHADADGRYFVRSLYFDNTDDKALREKLYGLPQREKFRIRLYNHDAGFIRLEKKSKRNGLGLKDSAALTKAQVEQLLAGDASWLLESRNPLCLEFYAKRQSQRLKPKTIVDYVREAYHYPFGNVRITFDMDVRTGLYATDLFDPNLRTCTTGAPGVLLMEVKYDAFLPDVIRDMLQTNARHIEANSKYAACRMYG